MGGHLLILSRSRDKWGCLTNLQTVSFPEFLSNLDDETLMAFGNPFCWTPSFSNKSCPTWQFPDFAVGGRLWVGSVVVKTKMVSCEAKATVQKKQEKKELGGKTTVQKNTRKKSWVARLPCKKNARKN